MKQINITDTDNIISVHLESDTILPGTYVNAEYNIPADYRVEQLNRIADMFVTQPIPNVITGYTTNNKIISTYEDVLNHFKDSDNKYFVTGYTDSKFALISKFFKKNDIANFVAKNANLNVITTPEPNYNDNQTIRTKIKFIIPGLDISAMILVDDQLIAEYVLYLDTENPIKYVDLGQNYSIFKYMRSSVEIPETANIILYDGLIEEPKIISEVFIDRGLNSGFEKMKKLKNITNMNELSKMGLGYYKINKKGYNFKNI